MAKVLIDNLDCVHITPFLGDYLDMFTLFYPVIVARDWNWEWVKFQGDVLGVKCQYCFWLLN